MRATELAGQYSSHVFAKWLGHTEKIADEFYRSVADEHYRRATGVAALGALGTQNPAQQTAAKLCQDSQGSPQAINADEFITTPSESLITLANPGDWAVRDSNPRPRPCKDPALPLS